ncbi:MAG: TatD family hydrolase [Candidatus Paceibacterota bacterium]|jgi:TatD DNase family protein
MIPKFFDAHTHLNMQFEQDWQEVGKRTIESGTWFVNVGADEKSSRLALEQVKELDGGSWCTVGIHPTEGNESDFEVIKELAKNEKVVAIGECGLEYFKIDDEEVKKRQCELFIKHIDLALEVGKPLMIHCRASLNNTADNRGSAGVIDAHEDVLEILKEYKSQVGDKLQFIMHFFTGTLEVANKFVELGGRFSFNGVITFTNQYDEVIKNIPLDRILSETDAPFVAPVPHRGERNEPAYVQFVAEHIAELRSEPHGQVLAALVKNAERFYSLG